MQPLQCHLETVTIITNLILNQPPLPNKLSVFTFSSLSDHYGFVDWARNTEMPAVNSKSNTTSHDVVSIRLQLETNLKAKEHFGGGRECRGNRCNGSVDTRHCDDPDILEQSRGVSVYTSSSVGFEKTKLDHEHCACMSVSVCTTCERPLWVGFNSSGIAVDFFFFPVNWFWAYRVDLIGYHPVQLWWDAPALLSVSAGWLVNCGWRNAKRSSSWGHKWALWIQEFTVLNYDNPPTPTSL